MNLSPYKRRSLDRRAEHLLTSLYGAAVSMPHAASPRSCVVLLTERTRPTIMARARIQPVLHKIGLHVEGLDELMAEIAASPDDDGNHYPVIVLIDQFARVGFVEAHTLSRGGDA